MEGKIALVTGAGSGIGRESALAFAASGARVMVSDVVVEGGEETVAQIKAAGGEATFTRADVSQRADVEALIRQTVETYGRLDCAHPGRAHRQHILKRRGRGGQRPPVREPPGARDVSPEVSRPAEDRSSTPPPRQPAPRSDQRGELAAGASFH